MARISFVQSGSGGGTPGGSNTQIQYNNAGAFGGVSKLTFSGGNLFATGSFKGDLDGNAATATTATSATTAATATSATSALTASYAVYADAAGSAATATSAASATSASTAVSASYATYAASAGSASSAASASTAVSASYATYAASAGSAVSSTTATSATTALTASYVLNAVSASFATTAAAVSLASNSTLFDGRSSSTFASLTANTFTGVQTFNSTVTGTTAYFSGDVVINGTASIALLETRNQQSLMVGDKYIVIMSASTDHVGLDGAGILFGSGAIAGTIDENGAHSYLRYRNAHDKLEVFPGLRVSGSLNTTGGFSAGYKTFTSNFEVNNAHHFCGVNTSGGAVTASLLACSTFATGQQIIIKDIGGFAGSSGKSILISAAGSDKIDGFASVNISAASGTINLMSDGFSNWFITNY